MKPDRRVLYNMNNIYTCRYIAYQNRAEISNLIFCVIEPKLLALIFCVPRLNEILNVICFAMVLGLRLTIMTRCVICLKLS